MLARFFKNNLEKSKITKEFCYLIFVKKHSSQQCVHFALFCFQFKNFYFADKVQMENQPTMKFYFVLIIEITYDMSTTLL